MQNRLHILVSIACHHKCWKVRSDALSARQGIPHNLKASIFMHPSKRTVEHDRPHHSPGVFVQLHPIQLHPALLACHLGTLSSKPRPGCSLQHQTAPRASLAASTLSWPPPTLAQNVMLPTRHRNKHGDAPQRGHVEPLHATEECELRRQCHKKVRWSRLPMQVHQRQALVVPVERQFGYVLQGPPQRCSRHATARKASKLLEHHCAAALGRLLTPCPDHLHHLHHPNPFLANHTPLLRKLFYPSKRSPPPKSRIGGKRWQALS